MQITIFRPADRIALAGAVLLFLRDLAGGGEYDVHVSSDRVTITLPNEGYIEMVMFFKNVAGAPAHKHDPDKTVLYYSVLFYKGPSRYYNLRDDGTLASFKRNGRPEADEIHSRSVQPNDDLLLVAEVVAATARYAFKHCYNPTRLKKRGTHKNCKKCPRQLECMTEATRAR